MAPGTTKTQRAILRTVLAVLLALQIGCSTMRNSPATVENPLLDKPSNVLASAWGINGFRNPAEDHPARLIPLEPYEPGKIPVVLIHGLASAPGTWRELLDAAEEDPILRGRYQFWVFQYPTGSSYLPSAAALRRSLIDTRRKLDPYGQDPALSQMVLVGHSMGGLIAKLQVTQSGDILWNAISDMPFNAFQADPQTRQQMAETMFFEPQPGVAHVVFIGTPHQGSLWSDYSVGRFGRSLIAFPTAVRENYQKVMASNANFLHLDTDTVPTSIDHLSPQSQVLQATARLPISPQVAVHSIIGANYPLPDDSPGDGVVSETSATFLGATSEVRIECKHPDMNRHPGTIAEIRRILYQQLQDVDRHTPLPLPIGQSLGVR
ncbi:esterase/lipase family protein [Blastopirellula marina]|nr:alpha/beta hydrolase [Blastopirellula marina]